jgi:lysophospholipase L1-like esterase
MLQADRSTYLLDVVRLLNRQWPDNRTVNVVFHGHSVPAGYTATPLVEPFAAYPHLVHRSLHERHPFAVINAIVTAVGGECSESGANRFESDVLCHRPDLVTIDYSLNDRGIGLGRARNSWRRMIESALEAECKVILLTPSMEIPGFYGEVAKQWDTLETHANQIRALAREYGVGLADSFHSFENHIMAGGEAYDLLSFINHPNLRGHQLIAQEILRWFPIVYESS